MAENLTNNTVTEGLIPPYSIEAEQSVLGGLLIDNDSLDDVADTLTEYDFYSNNHKIIYRGINVMLEKLQPVDIVTLAEFLKKQDELDKVGGLSYLGMLVRDTPTSANIKAYAKIIHEHSVLRNLKGAVEKISRSVFNPNGKDSATILGDAEQLILEIGDKGTRAGKDFIQIKDTLKPLTERIQTLSENSGALTGLETGFADFDEETSGLQNSDLIIIAGRPSMGKTSLAMNITEHVAIKGKKAVAVFSMEMDANALSLRMFSSLGLIDQSKLRKGDLGENWARFSAASSLLQDAQIFIDDSAAQTLTVSDIRARARRLKRRHDLDLIVIDYIQQLLPTTGGSAGNSETRATQLAETSRGLKALARELKIPVIALSQLNRSLEHRPNKRPIMSDLRESGAIEQDADLIVFIYRDEVYNEESLDKGIAEIIISKQRNGPIGTVKLKFNGQYVRFDNLAHGSAGDYGGGM